MRKFFRSFIVLAFVVMLGVMATGCSLFQQNLDYDYNRIVATMEYKDDVIISITKKELFDTYNSYGYQYVQYYGDTVEDAYGKTIDALLDREVAIRIAVEQFDPNRKNNYGVLGMLTKYEADTARKTAFDSLNNALNQFIDEIRSAEATIGQDEPAADNTVKYQPYEKTITVSDDFREFSLDLEDYRDVPYIGLVSALWTPELPPNTSTKTFTKALARIVRNLEIREKGFEKLINRDNHNDKRHRDEDWGWFVNDNSGLVKNSLDPKEIDVLNREILRMVKSNEKSTLVNRLSTMFTLGLEGEAGFDAYMNRGEDWTAFEDAVKYGGIANVTANNAVDAYKNNLRQAIVNYNLNPPSDMETDLVGLSEGQGLSGVYYVPESIANKLFTVSHILVSFTDAQRTRFAEIDNLAATDSSFNKEEELLKLYAATKTADGKTVYAVYDDVKSAVDNAENLQERYEIFRDKIYEYNTDPGMQNPEFEYVMTTTKSKNGMIEEFTDASLELKADGEKGAVSAIVWGSYGAHIIMYTRDLSDFIYTVESNNLVKDAYEKALFATQTSYGNKTIFDTLLGGPNYDSYEKALIRQYKSNKSIKVFKDIFKNLFKSK